METIKHTMGDTVNIDIKIENLDPDATDIYLDLYRLKTSSGMSDRIKRLSPTKIDFDEKTVSFHYNSGDFLLRPSTYYGHFHVNNDGTIENMYYRIKAKY